MLRLAAILLLILPQPAAAQPGSDPRAAGYIPPPCDQLYLLQFSPRATALDARAEAIAEVFASTHARSDTRLRMLVSLDAKGSSRARQDRAIRRIEAVRAVLARFGIPRARVEIVFVAVLPPYLDRAGTISLVEMVPPGEMARRRAAYPANVAC